MQASATLELEPTEIAELERLLPAPVIALALLLVEADPEFAPRWQAAGADWTKRAEVLRDAIVWVVTPERVPVGAH